MPEAASAATTNLGGRLQANEGKRDGGGKAEKVSGGEVIGCEVHTAEKEEPHCHGPVRVIWKEGVMIRR
jgi:hypothetical protein